MQLGDTEELPARGELVQLEPIFFYPLPAMHHPFAFLANVRRMRRQRARLEQVREWEHQAQRQVDTRASRLATRIAARVARAAILSERIEAGDLQA